MSCKCFICKTMNCLREWNIVSFKHHCTPLVVPFCLNLTLHVSFPGLSLYMWGSHCDYSDNCMLFSIYIADMDSTTSITTCSCSNPNGRMRSNVQTKTKESYLFAQRPMFDVNSSIKHSRKNNTFPDKSIGSFETVLSVGTIWIYGNTHSQ